MPNMVSGQGNPYSKLVVLGDFPNQTEDRVSKPFLGASGDLLDRIFTELGYPNWRTDFWLTYVSRYRPPFNDVKQIASVVDIEEEKERLYKELLSIDANCILAIGPLSFETVSGATKLLTYRGSILPSQVGEARRLYENNSSWSFS